VCYGRGGAEPTVTDANLVLGRINPDKFLGGELKLDVKGAERAIAERIAEPLGYGGRDGLIKMADGILNLATVIMAGAIRQVSVEHGLDPRDFILFSYGGGGPLHGSALAHELNIPTLVIPPAPGNFSAVGMLLADARIDASKTFTARLGEESVNAMQEMFAAMEHGAAADLAKEFGASDVFYERHAEMRYVGQNHSIKVPVSGLADPAAIKTAFERDYKRRYGHADARAASEIQALHLSAFARQKRPDLGKLPQIAATAIAVGKRQVYFGAQGGWAEAAVYDRASLKPGFKAAGPSVIEEYGSTTLVAPGDSFEIGPMHEIRIDCSRK
jgi:N-methylhydantoinase A